MASYANYVIPTAQKANANLLFAMLTGDPLDAQNISQPLSANGLTPFIHWFGGKAVDEAWMAIYQNLSTNLPAPAGGWPLRDDNDNVVLTEVNAQAAADALYINVNTGPTAEDLPELNRQTVFAALNLMRPIPDE